MTQAQLIQMQVNKGKPNFHWMTKRGVKTYYNEQILLFKSMCVRTSSRPILKGFFINYIHNKVIQIVKN